MKNLRKVISLKEKCKIIQELQSGASQSNIVKTYMISKSSVSRLWNEREKILLAKIAMPGIKSKVRSTKHFELDDKLLLWFREARAKGLPISGQILVGKANDIGKNIGMIDFDCSLGWIDRFKKRHDIISGIISGEAQSVDMTKIMNWYENDWPKIRANYKNEDIFNADETGLFYKCTPENTLRLKGENCSGGKLSKDRVTVLLCASATGEKLEPLIIGKYAKPRCFKNQNLSKFDYKSNNKAWMTSSIFFDQLRKWDNMFRIKKRKIILIVDNCSSHPKVNNDLLTNIKLVFLPANTTSVLQPCDQGIIKNFKHYYRKSIVTKIIQAFDLKKNFNMHLLDALHFIKQAWDEVSAKTIMNCFHHSKIIQQDEDLIVIDNQISLIQIFENKVPELFKSEEEIINFINVDDGVVNCEEIIEEIGDNRDDDCIVTEQTEIKNVSLLDAIGAIETIKTFCLTNEDTNEIYPHICKIENYMDKKYLSRRCHQKTLLDYDFTEYYE